MKPTHRPLFSAVTTELASGGGASVETPAAPAAEAAPATAETPAPTFLQTVLAGLKDKGALAAENTSLLQRAEKADAEILTLQGQIVTLQSELNTLRGERQQIEGALKEAQTAKTTVEAAAAAEVATIGFPAAQLPESAKAGETREELEAQLAAETDNNRRYALAEKINALG